jgi:uncharacterized protein
MENYRFSSYAIPVKLENEKDKYMLIHGYTGAIDIVSEKVIRYLEHVDDLQISSMQLSEATIDALITRGYLTNRTEEEEVKYVCKLADILHQKNKILHKNFVFLVAYDCNFRCPYCYERKVLKDSRQWSRKVFTKEMVDKAYDAISKIGGDKRLHYPQIVLYGGEPLLSQNRGIVEYIVNKGKDLGYRFLAITNGYDLDAFEDLLTSDKLSSLQITIDGSKKIHDQRRIHYQTKTSFDKIISNIALALERDVEIIVRVNNDATNFNELKKIEQLFRDLGYYDKNNLRIYSARLFDYKYNNRRLSFLNQSEYNKLHKESAYKYPCTVSGIAQTLCQAITDKKRINFSSTYCSAQTGSHIFDPFGDIYGCWEDVGNVENMIGHYDPVEWTEIKKLWHYQNIAVSPDCVRCKYAFFCRGGCIAQGKRKRGVFGPGFCNSYPDTFHDAINLAYKKMHEWVKNIDQ